MDSLDREAGVRVTLGSISKIALPVSPESHSCCNLLRERFIRIFSDDISGPEDGGTAGVPQGSNLGPLLFILFINDLASVLKCSECLLFADDLKFFGPIRSNLDVVLLQRDLDYLFKWCTDNKLPLNIEKCSILSYTQAQKAQALNYDYKVNNPVLSRSNSVTDFGFIFDAKLDFSQYIDAVVSKA
ncbi:hypothetical protein AVEN_214450-1 [Araneus ventricosus]|uniref:Reverse transcriptase domain-containing protein n=1 Tax=Araneus ventricosus TaxID=182803 RepID=A0A4Y2NKY2_ARAVE|nr:hypothetical protein AVEN_214450-1 [Araneus ventricosus]